MPALQPNKLRGKASNYSHFQAFPNIVSKFPLTYRNREDITNLPPGVLVKGSKNILSNVSERIQIRKGYTLDGIGSTTIAPILSSYDWLMHIGQERHLRVGNGVIQYRYTDSVGVVTWRELMTTVKNEVNFCEYWNNTNFQDQLLFVNGTSNIFSWSGGITLVNALSGVVTAIVTTPTDGGINYKIGDILTISSGITNATVKVSSVDSTTGAVTFIELLSTGSGYTTGVGKLTTGGSGTGCTIEISTVASPSGTTLTKQGTTTWGEENFSPTGKLLINGTEYTYTGGTGTLTLTGVTPNPSALTDGNIVIQQVVTTTNASTTGLPTVFSNNLIANLKNQIYIGDLKRRDVYVSKINSFTNYSFSSPRTVGQGAIITLDACPVAFIEQDENMYISAGKDQWYKTIFTTSADLQLETLTIERLKTNSQQGAQSQAMVGKMKNNVIMVNFEPTFDTLGLVDNILGTPQTTNLSDTIKLDFDSYDFTDGSVFYYKYFLYVAVPKEGLIRIYSLVTRSWEAPQYIPVSRFAIIDGELYGHSYNTPETYKLFSGTSDNGHPIPAKAVFSYQNYGSRTAKKSMNKFYVEGYISQNTLLTLGITYEIDGCAQQTSYTIDGTDTSVVCVRSSDASLGKVSLGKNPLGGTLNLTNLTDLPPKFRVFKTFPRINFFENQISFESTGIDMDWELLAFGGNAEESTDLAVDITQ